jgi:hypothetical protein
MKSDIEARSAGSDASTIAAHIITWYAPAAKRFVRREGQDMAEGRVRHKSVDELVEYSLQSSFATKP